MGTVQAAWSQFSVPIVVSGGECLMHDRLQSLNPSLKCRAVKMCPSNSLAWEHKKKIKVSSAGKRNVSHFKLFLVSGVF